MAITSLPFRETSPAEIGAHGAAGEQVAAVLDPARLPVRDPDGGRFVVGCDRAGRAISAGWGLRQWRSAGKIYYRNVNAHGLIPCLVSGHLHVTSDEGNLRPLHELFHRHTGHGAQLHGHADRAPP